MFPPRIPQIPGVLRHALTWGRGEPAPGRPRHHPKPEARNPKASLTNLRPESLDAKASRTRNSPASRTLTPVSLNPEHHTLNPNVGSRSSESSPRRATDGATSRTTWRAGSPTSWTLNPLHCVHPPRLLLPARASIRRPSTATPARAPESMHSRDMTESNTNSNIPQCMLGQLPVTNRLLKRNSVKPLQSPAVSPAVSRDTYPGIVLPYPEIRNSPAVSRDTA